MLKPLFGDRQRQHTHSAVEGRQAVPAGEATRANRWAVLHRRLLKHAGAIRAFANPTTNAIAACSGLRGGGNLAYWRAIAARRSASRCTGLPEEAARARCRIRAVTPPRVRGDDDGRPRRDRNRLHPATCRQGHYCCPRRVPRCRPCRARWTPRSTRSARTARSS
jgi:hypothetical protein